MRWATITEKPTISAWHKPLKSQVLEATRPMDAEASLPRRPTMEASIYCMAMEESWARMAGTLNCSVNRICSGSDNESPARKTASRSFFGMVSPSLLVA